MKMIHFVDIVPIMTISASLPFLCIKSEHDSLSSFIKMNLKFESFVRHILTTNCTMFMWAIWIIMNCPFGRFLKIVLSLTFSTITIMLNLSSYTILLI